jgi:hypothetical protein
MTVSTCDRRSYEKVIFVDAVNSDNEMGGGGGFGKNCWGPAVRKGARVPGPEFVFIFLGSITFCRWYKLNLSDQAQITWQLTVFQI